MVRILPNRADRLTEFDAGRPAALSKSLVNGSSIVGYCGKSEEKLCMTVYSPKKFSHLSSIPLAGFK
jgi:hypothetical protein